ncbi:hypothetical protein PF004_g31715 [Phytophthora fragariae]|uniref:Uncharacterized protein n=1 Tax=Phytophthora fragariae TaxID=53985 RepID=A0A6G0M8M5_9STRA|nr:hypothetical protein PF004_g31715 [Phytophthora fragariae]
MASTLAHDKLRLPTSKQYPAAWPKLVMASTLAHDKLRLPTSKQCPAAWSKLVMGVRAIKAKLPSPSRRFMTPEVAGRRCCY